MSKKGTSLHLRVNPGAVEVEIHSASASDVQVRHIKDDGEEGEWEIVEEEAGEHLELVVATGSVPLHLLRRSRLQPLQGWSPEERIRRAFEWGQKDTQAALEGIGTTPPRLIPSQIRVSTSFSTTPQEIGLESPDPFRSFTKQSRSLVGARPHQADALEIRSGLTRISQPS